VESIAEFELISKKEGLLMTNGLGMVEWAWGPTTAGQVEGTTWRGGGVKFESIVVFEATWEDSEEMKGMGLERPAEDWVKERILKRKNLRTVWVLSSNDDIIM
jgi:hypothetical protein